MKILFYPEKAYTFHLIMFLELLIFQLNKVFSNFTLTY